MILKKITVMMMTAASVILTAAPLTAPAFAAEVLSAKITVSVEMDKGYVLNPTEITVTDVTGDGKLDYDDALIVAHDLYYPGGAKVGLTDQTVWGREGAFGCYISDENGSDLTYGEAAERYTGLKDGYSLQIQAQWLPFDGSVRIRMNGELPDGTALEQKEIEVSDLNKNGMPDIEDAVRTALNQPDWTLDNRYRYDCYNPDGNYVPGFCALTDGCTVEVNPMIEHDWCYYLMDAKRGNKTEPGSTVQLIAMKHAAGECNLNDAVIRNTELYINDQPSGIFTDEDGRASVTLPAGGNIIIDVRIGNGIACLPYHVARANMAAAPVSSAEAVTTTETTAATLTSTTTTTASSATTAAQESKAAVTTKAVGAKTGDGMPAAVISAIGALGMCVSFASTGKRRSRNKH